MPTFLACGERGTETPVGVVANHVAEHLVDLAAQGGGEEGVGCLPRVSITVGTGIFVRVEASKAQQIDGLGVHFFFRVDHGAHKLANFFVYVGDFDAELEIHVAELACDVEQADDFHLVVLCESCGVCQVTERNGVDGVVADEVDVGIEGVSVKFNHRARLQS